MSGASSRVNDTYETQNDQRSDELHAKIRTGKRAVLTSNLRNLNRRFQDIHNDVERQNLMLDDTACLPINFNQSEPSVFPFGDTLAQSARRAGQKFGIKVSVKWRTAVCVVLSFFALL